MDSEAVNGKLFVCHRPAPQTRLSIAEWCAAVERAACVLGLALQRATLAILWAQYALETARGARCFGWNLGNVMRFPGTPCDWCELRTFEYLDPDGAGPRKVERVDTIGTFRVYPDADAGALAYLEQLRGGRFRPAFDAALSGDPRRFAVVLKERGYYTAPVEDYARGIVSLAGEVAHALDGLELVTCEQPVPLEGLWPIELEPHPPTSAATPLRAAPGEHSIKLEDPTL